MTEYRSFYVHVRVRRRVRVFEKQKKRGSEQRTYLVFPASKAILVLGLAVLVGPRGMMRSRS